MAPSTAGCFLILAMVLFHHSRPSCPGSGFFPMVVLVFLVTLFSLLELAGDITGIDFNFEDRMTAGMGTLKGIPIGRMSPATAITFIVVGLGSLMSLLRVRSPSTAHRLGHVASSLGVLTLLVGSTVLLAYLYGTPLMYSGAVIPMAATTAIAFIFLGLALTAGAGPASFPLCLVAGDTTPALLSRVFLPLSVAAVFLSSVVFRFVSVDPDINDAIALAVLVVFVGILTAIMVTRVSHAMGHALDELNRKLRQSEEQHRSIIQTAMDGFWMVDMQGRLVEVNDTYCRMSGYTADELLKMQVSDLELTETLEVVEEHARQIIDQGEDRFESRHLRKDGSSIDVEISAQHRLGRWGKLVVFIRDITARKQAEQQLRQQQAMLARTEQMAQIGSWELEPQTGSVLWSAEMYRIFQWPPDSAPPTLEACQHLFPPDEMHRVKRTIENVLRTGGSFTFDVQYLRADGQLRHGLIWGLAERDATGEVIRLVGSFQDVTVLKKAEVERERLLTAIEQTGEMIFVTDAEGTIQYANPTLAAVTGYSREEVIGKNPRIFKSGQQDENFYRTMYATITSGRTWHGRMVNKRKDGSLYTEEASLSPVMDDAGNIVSYVAVNRDITESLMMESRLREAQKMESVGRLAGGVAHDYNNMLSVIIGYADLTLERLSPDNQMYEYVSEIRGAAQRSTEITRQLLAFARKQTIAPVALDLNDSVESMLKMLRRLIGEDINLAWRPSTGLGAVQMDPSQVDQILANLCVNARDAIGGVGHVTIETGMATFDSAYCADHPGFVPGEYVMLAVSDDGCGMDRKTVKKIFEPFFTTKDLGQGTGLGLSTVYGIVMQNNGFINVYSEPGKGTTFRIYLSRHAEAAVEEAVGKSGDIPVGHGEVVLVVEDEEAILKLASRILAKLGYSVLIAQSPRQALDRIDGFPDTVHLLVTDVVMPEMNGRELANRLRVAYPALKTLFMSGYTANVIAHRGVLDDGVHFMQKPFSRESLATKVRKALDC
ncbi:MAG: PAS domain S-box protein [Desulfobulbus sp.]|nr:PAS domain S-box protein [Desulfobulbus sp.]